MKRSSYVCMFILFCALTVLAEGTYQAGIASVVITPDENTWLAGYASRTEPAQGAVQELYAKAITLRDTTGQQAVFVTTDLIGLTPELSDHVAKTAEKELGIPRSAVMITSSHTHCSPVLRNNLEDMYFLNQEEKAKVYRYTDQLKEKLAQLVLDSAKELQPVTLLRGTGHATFGANRRAYNLDGIHFGVNPIGPVDHDVPVMVVKDLSGNILSIIFGYACHNTTLDINHYCGDYAGYAQEYIEQANPSAEAMFFAGCGGDINPHPRRDLQLAKDHGRHLADAVQKVLEGDLLEVKGELQHQFSMIDLPLSEAPGKEELQEQAQSEDKYIAQRAQRLLRQLESEGKIPETCPYPIQVWRLGDEFIMIALGGEVVVDYSLWLKHELGKDNTWVIAYANDVMAYIPSLRVLREGGYEGNDSMIYYGLHGPWQPTVESLIIEEVHKLVNDKQIEEQK
jgi:neutral ceramidase